MSWVPIIDGETIGTPGSEEGVIVLDEEHPSGARLTLERGGHTAPWSITCGIYGTFMHTAFTSTEAEGRAKYSAMKVGLEEIMAEENEGVRHSRMKRFADVF